eukprot:CAMPEP_0114264224 /NCGR_PEP_ID=MMETSP0058-20121206/23048_1 /TAXON_ID=36894 /ORGANISM="Pyramimonas parkeae, CCMP726" /LENGTH=769 /DNA_ID=CAMNT_0001380795 /DNA_START=272 /DNA_END=2582 /DNA_ORIENTATION=-
MRWQLLRRLLHAPLAIAGGGGREGAGARVRGLLQPPQPGGGVGGGDACGAQVPARPEPPVPAGGPGDGCDWVAPRPLQVLLAAKCDAVNVLVTAMKCGAEPPLEITTEAEAGGVGDCILCLKHPFLWPTLAAQYDLSKQRLLTLRPWSKRGSLRDRLHRAEPAAPHVVKYAGAGKPLPMNEICRYSRQILEAVHYLLNRGLRVAHMHSGNVLLDQNNNAFLTDVIELQLFHLPHSPGKEGVLLLESIAPCAAAVIGFGYLLFEMAVGRPPIVGELVSGGGVNTQHNLPLPVVEILDSIFVPPLPIKPASLPTVQELLSRPEFRSVRLVADVAFITQRPPAGMAAEILERATQSPSDQPLSRTLCETPSGSEDVNEPPKAGASTKRPHRSNSKIDPKARASARAPRPPQPPYSPPGTSSSARSSCHQNIASKPHAEPSPAPKLPRGMNQVVAVATATACTSEPAGRTSPAGSGATTPRQSSNRSRSRKRNPSSARERREQPRASSSRKGPASEISGPMFDQPPSKAPLALRNPHTSSYNSLFGDDADEYLSDDAERPPLITPEKRSPTTMARNAYQVHMSQMGASWGFTPSHARHADEGKLSTVAALTRAFGENSLDSQTQADHEFLLFGDVVDALPSAVKADSVRKKKKKNKEQRHKTSDVLSTLAAFPLPLEKMNNNHTKQESLDVKSDASTLSQSISNSRNTTTVESSSRKHSHRERLFDPVEIPPDAVGIKCSDKKVAYSIEKKNQGRVQSLDDHHDLSKDGEGRA